MSARKQLRNGKSVSTPIAPRSASKQARPHGAELGRLLATVYDRYQKLPDRVANARCRREFVFHMTDWLHDLECLTKLYTHPEKATKKSAGDAVYGFLIHALPHLMEAGRLLEGHEIRNPFLNARDAP